MGDLHNQYGRPLMKCLCLVLLLGFSGALDAVKDGKTDGSQHRDAGNEGSEHGAALQHFEKSLEASVEDPENEARTLIEQSIQSLHDELDHTDDETASLDGSLEKEEAKVEDQASEAAREAAQEDAQEEEMEDTAAMSSDSGEEAAEDAIDEAGAQAEAQLKHESPYMSLDEKHEMHL